MDPRLKELLRWGIENSDTSKQSTGSDESYVPPRPIDPEVLEALFGGPSEAELMKQFMEVLHSDEVDLENKLVAFDNFEQLVESIDNANNLEPLGLWTPLIELLQHQEPDMRRMAAWCIGTAVQNNQKAQDKLIVLNALPKLISLSTSDPDAKVRRKAIYAISSAVRNYQPALDEVIRHMPKEIAPTGRIDAGNMDAVDAVMDKLKDFPV
ncbi:hypothetical protein VTN31DRAFT_6961 [Thermomyces dupontii]|uniref:uncharacterized protein n=1 Tax=Talaromyces thermophilus TaxID=28565 RepID=UPI00374289CA